MLDKNKILNVLKNNNLCVLSTADLSGKSESAIMMSATRNDLSIIMCTSPEARKLKNMAVNDKVSLVVGGFNNDPSLQIEGKAKILNETEKKEMINFMISERPETKEMGIESEIFLMITPNWIRCIDYSQEPNVEEMSL